MSASLTTRVRTIAEGLEDEESLEAMDPLEIKYEVTEGGDVTEVCVVLTVGGPHIEVECKSRCVVGHWSGESYRRCIESDAVHDYGRRLADRMEARID